MPHEYEGDGVQDNTNRLMHTHKHDAVDGFGIE